MANYIPPSQTKPPHHRNPNTRIPFSSLHQASLLYTLTPTHLLGTTPFSPRRRPWDPATLTAFLGGR